MNQRFNIPALSIFAKRIVIGMLTTSLVLTSWLMDGSVAYSFPVSTHRASQLTWSNPIALVNILSTPEIYRYKDRPSSDGIGKFYMGREIAQVMGHLGASWLERPSRIQEEKPHVLMANLDIQPTDVVADIGAGTGYLTARLAPKVPQGKVLAVDVQPEMLEMLGDRIEQSSPEDGLDNVELILASEDDPHLPMDAVDMAIMLDVYHELAYPYEVMQQVVKALRPGGKMVLVEYRGENPLIPIKRLHKMTEKQARKEMKKAGLNWMETSEELPRQHLMVFEKT